MKKMRINMKKNIVVWISVFSLLLPSVLYAEEAAPAEETTSVEAIASVGEAAPEVIPFGLEESADEPAVETASVQSLSSFSFTELRDQRTYTVKPADGKPAIYVFGGIGSCGITGGMLAKLNEKLRGATGDFSVYVFDIIGNTDETMLSAVNSMKLDAKLHVATSATANNSSALRRSCTSVATANGAIQGSSYTMPLIGYKNAANEIVDATTGSVDSNALVEKLKAIGIDVAASTAPARVTVTGECDYNYANEVLTYVNELRSELGLAALAMDQELLEVAMNRAAEISVFYSHTRPNNEPWETISDVVQKGTTYGENIAAGYETPQEVFEGWKNSAGHYANMVNPDYTTIGIGAFYIDGTFYWSQNFGNYAATAPTAKSFETRTYAVEIDPDNAELLLLTSKNGIKAGKNVTLRLSLLNMGTGMTLVDVAPGDFTWTVSDETIAVINQKGVIQGKKEGTVTVDVVNRANENLWASAELTIVAGDGTTDPDPNTPGGETPGGENPGSETPGGETPGSETPGGGTPGGENPGSETPGGGTPGGETPGSETPGQTTQPTPGVTTTTTTNADGSVTTTKVTVELLEDGAVRTTTETETKYKDGKVEWKEMVVTKKGCQALIEEGSGYYYEHIDDEDDDDLTYGYQTRKKTQTIYVSCKSTVKLKAKNIKKKNKSYLLGAFCTGDGAISAKVTKTPKGAKKYISVSKNGKVTIKKKAKKGSYYVTVTAAETSRYKKAEKVIVFKVV